MISFQISSSSIISSSWLSSISSLVLELGLATCWTTGSPSAIFETANDLWRSYSTL